MKRVWKFYKVSEGSGLNSGRVGMAIIAANSTIYEMDPGRYKDFDKTRETVLIDKAGLFTMFDNRLSPAKPEEIPTFFLKTVMGECFVANGINDQDWETVRYAVSAYGFLLPLNQMVGGPEFAALVKQHYSLENPQNRAVHDLLAAL